jgi:hypothetical protein
LLKSYFGRVSVEAGWVGRSATQRNSGLRGSTATNRKSSNGDDNDDENDEVDSDLDLDMGDIIDQPVSAEDVVFYKVRWQSMSTACLIMCCAMQDLLLAEILQGVLSAYVEVVADMRANRFESSAAAINPASTTMTSAPATESSKKGQGGSSIVGSNPNPSPSSCRSPLTLGLAVEEYHTLKVRWALTDFALSAFAC